MAMTVEVSTTEVVVPAEETPAGVVWLSNLDQVALLSYTATVYFYRSNGDPGFFTAGAVRDGLARALVPFYPLAGRLGRDAATGRVQVDCTGEGVVFSTACSDHYVLDDLLSEFVPCRAMRDLFVPPAPPSTPPCVLLLVQVTYLRCGGAVLGLALHHSVADARSAAHFVQTWASMARGGGSAADADAYAPPCFDHRPLAARPAGARAVLYDHREYKPDLAPPAYAVDKSTYASGIVTLAEREVGALKARCPGESTFRAVVALVWQCACRARALPPEAETRLYSVIDMRARLAPPLPPGYFGNAVVRTSTAATVGEVVSSPVSYAARLARAATCHGDEYARSLVDYLEAAGAAAIQPLSSISRADLRAVSWMGMSLCDPDFGWGTPAFMGPALMYSSGFVYVMHAPEKDGALVLVLSLEPESMPEFRKIFAEELARLIM